MQLIVISSPDFLSNEAQIVTDLFAAGLQTYHLRKPDATLENLRSFLKQIDSNLYDRIALHQHHVLAAEFGITRLHFRENIRKNLDPKQLNLYVNKGYKLTTSVHELSDLPASEQFEYVFFSPVFDSLSKPGYPGKLTANFELTKSVDTKVVALGGITAGNIKLVKSIGFQAAAVLGAIWNEPLYALQNFQILMNQLNEDNR
jgi:thiamine-phosphate pyrophosphorylase